MKVSVPKEEIDKITREYNCSENEATRAYLDAQENASQTFIETLVKDLGDKKSDDFEKDISVLVPTPKEIKEHLDRFVIGQEVYKRRLSIAAAYHFAIIKHLRDNPSRREIKRFRKKNTVIAGPSGSGKTYCAEVLGDFLNVPTLIIDATDYTEAGYVGKTSDDMVRELIDMAPGETKKEQAAFIRKIGGIIFIDEMDKKAKDGSLAGHDISREGFQRSVLKLIERKYVAIDNPNLPIAQMRELMNQTKKGGEAAKKERMLSTENILFILGGSFERTVESLEQIVKKRLNTKGNVKEDGSIVINGFGHKNLNADEKKIKNYYKEATADDYIRFGMLPELVGRVPIRTFVNLLSKNDLMRIMTETEDSILTQYKLEFEAFNISLTLADDAIEFVAEASENQKTGARALISVWENILTDFQFELPGSNHTRLEVNRELCNKPKDYLLKLLEKSPFVDFIEGFNNEFGIELIFDDDALAYVESLANSGNMQISETLKDLLSKASCLNYMSVKNPFSVTKEMLEEKNYFDDLFTKWHDEQLDRFEQNENE